MKKMLVLSLSFIGLSQIGFVFSEVSQVSQDTCSNQVCASTRGVVLADWKGAKGKQLHAQEMALLSALFESAPVGILRVDLVQRSAIKMLNEIDLQIAAGADLNRGKDYIQEQIAEIVKPVESFFAIARNYDSVVKPLIEESLGADCFILKAYETDGDICKFLEEQVDSIETLQRACTELLQFFKDLKNSLGEGARKAYIDLRKKLVEKKRKVAASKAA